MENLRKLIGDRIRRKREEAGFSTQGELADEIGADTSRVSRWETGDSMPDKKYQNILVQKLKMSAEDFDVSEKPEKIEKPQDVNTQLLTEFRELKRVIQQPSNPIVREIVGILATFDDSKLGRTLDFVQAIARGKKPATLKKRKSL